MKRRFLAVFCAILSFVLMSANRHSQTSVNPETLYMVIEALGESVNINLESPGLVIDKFSDGRIRHMTVPFINSMWEIDFYPRRSSLEKKERVALIKRFRLFDNYYLLDGKTQRLGENGDLISESSWVEGLLYGKQTIFYKSGQVSEEQYFERGFPVGEWKRYFENGRLASKMIFPKNRKEWNKTEISSIKTSGGENVYNMAYRHAIPTSEIWYDQDGFKVKEIFYSLYKNKHRYIVERTGRYQNYNDDEEVIKYVDFAYGNGLGISNIVFNNMGRREEIFETWYEGKLFKRIELEPVEYLMKPKKMGE